MDRYAFLRIAMSWSEALETLGFSPNSAPTQDQIKEAYRQHAFAKHPDRNNGKDEEFKLVGIAYDILKGSPRPTYDRRPDDGPEPVRTQYTPPPSVTVTFEEAVSKAGLPSGVEWLFITPSQAEKDGWRGDSSGKSGRALVAYGRTDNQHVFLAAHNYEEYSNFALGGFHNDIWKAKSYEYPIKADEGKDPAWLYRHVVSALSAIGFNGKFNSKVIDAKGWKPSARMPHDSAVSIKHWLQNTKQVAEGDASVANAKNTVELRLEMSTMGEKPGFFADDSKGGRYSGDHYRLTLVLNGRPYVLDKNDTVKLLRHSVGGKRALEAIYGTYFYGGEKKQLNRLKNGKALIGWMAENFKGLPDEAISILKATEAQMKG